MKGRRGLFRDWLGRQDEGKEYDYLDVRGCVHAQFCKWMGVPYKIKVVPVLYEDCERIEWMAVTARPFTMGAVKELFDHVS
tara:strand:+ start:2528 stop:2770 length:243 start_codon:yes stop_codon:yes gene_type:complete